MKRAAIYMRVSTDKQAQEGDSIPAQRDALLKYIDQHEDMILAGQYLDDGVSGTRSDRDELNRLLDDVKAGKVDLILVTKLDRLYRSIRHYLNMMDTLDRAGVGWLAIWEPIYDTTTPQGRLIVNQMMSIAQFEAENTGQRVKQVLAYKVSQGQVNSGNTSPGFMIQDKRLVHDPETAPIVKAFFEQYASEGNLSRIARQAPAGFPQTVEGWKQLFRRTIYVGQYRDNDRFCEPLVSRDLFDRVQRQLAINIKAGVRHEYLFTGLIRCPACGATLSAAIAPKRGKTVIRYRCQHHYRVNRSCPYTGTVGENRLESYLIDNLAELVSDAQIRAETERKPAEDIAKKKSTLEKRIARLKDLYVEELITLDEYKADREKYQTQLDALQMPPEGPESHVDRFDVQKGINLYAALDKPEKRLFGDLSSAASRLTERPSRSFSYRLCIVVINITQTVIICYHYPCKEVGITPGL